MSMSLVNEELAVSYIECMLSMLSCTHCWQCILMLWHQCLEAIKWD